MTESAHAEEITHYLKAHGGPHQDHVLTLAEWASHYHGGQGSALYSFASTRKLVCNSRIDQGYYLSEVEKDLENSGQFDDPEESRAVLGALKAFFEAACCDWDTARDEEHDHTLNPSDYIRP